MATRFAFAALLLGAAAPAVVTRPARADEPPPSGRAVGRVPVRLEVPVVADDSVGAGQRLAGLIVSGVGAAAFVVGGVFGLEAFSKWSTASAACPGHVCRRASDVQTGADAGTDADVSTWLMGAGAGALATGAILYVTSPRAASALAAPRGRWVGVSPSFGLAGAGAVVAGIF